MDKRNIRETGWWFGTVITFLVFVVLKLVGVIDWKWIWVMSPLWIFYGNAIVFIIVIILIASVKERIENEKRTREALRKIRKEIEQER